MQSVNLPETGYVRLPQILLIFPISKSSWWAGIKKGIYPKGIKVGPRTTVWRIEDINKLFRSLNNE